MRIENFLERLEGVRPSGSGWVAKCPAHDDRSPSLSVTEGDDSRILVRCFSGCETTDIVEALDLELRDLMPDHDSPFSNKPVTQRRKVTRKGTLGDAIMTVENRLNRKCSAEWVYHNGAGEPIAAAVRWDDSEGGKTVLPFHKTAGGWVNAAPPEPRTLYQLPEILKAGTVLVCEGEKACDAAREIGFTATTSPMGSKAARKADWTPLAGKVVWVLPDNDKPGAAYAETVAGILSELDPPASVRTIVIPGLPPAGDIADWVADRDGWPPEELRKELKELAADSPEYAVQTVQTSEISKQWPPVVPFEEENLPSFPVDALSPILAEWVKAESEATQTPLALPGMLSLAALSFCASKRVTVCPWPGWIEPVNLFCCVALPPGSRKSPVFADALAPLREAERELIEQAKPDVARERSDRRQAEKKLASLEKKAAEGGKPEAREAALELAAELSAWDEPHLPRLLAENITEEQLTNLLAANGRLMSASAEGGGPFDLMAGKYSRNGAESFGVYLAGYSGDSLTVDRVGRDGVDIPKACLTVCYCVQPSVLRTLGRSETMRGRGLLGRFAWSVPRNGIGSRKVRGLAVPEHIRSSYTTLLYALAMDDAKIALELSPEAATELERFAAELEPEMAEGGSLEPAADWASKAVGLTARLAAVLHIGGEKPSHIVNTETTRAAITLTRHLVPHALKALALSEGFDPSGGADARYVLRWVRKHGTREFTRAELWQSARRYFQGRPDDVDEALRELEERNYLRRLPEPKGSKGRGGKPGPSYIVNPEVCTVGTAERTETGPEGVSTVRTVRKP